MIQELSGQERESILSVIDEEVDRRKAFYENPFKIQVALCGAIRGFDVSLSGLCELTKESGENYFYILNQNIEHPEFLELLRVSALFDPHKIQENLYRNFPQIFVGEWILCWGEGRNWFTVFDSDLAFGLLVSKSAEAASTVAEIYGRFDVLHEVWKAFEECLAYELQDYSEKDRDQIVRCMHSSWRYRTSSVGRQSK